MSTHTAKVAIEIFAQQILGASAASGYKGEVESKIAELRAFVDRVQDSGSNAVRTHIDNQSGVGASQNTDYDLVGSLSDLENTTINFDVVYYIVVYNRSDTYAITIGPGTTNSFGVGASNQGFWADASDRSYIPPESLLVHHSRAGVPAAAGSTDSLRLSTLGSTSNNAFSVLIIGRDNA